MVLFDALSFFPFIYLQKNLRKANKLMLIASE